MNEWIFSAEDKRKDFIREVLESSWTPSTRHEDLIPFVRRAFGNDGGNVLSDCLSPADVEVWGKFVLTDEFEDAFVTGEQNDTTDREKQLKEATENVKSWDQCKKVINKQSSDTDRFIKNLKSRVRELRQHGALALQQQDQSVNELCKTNQCRLKKVFLAAERKIMTSSMANAKKLNDAYEELIKKMWDGGWLRKADFAVLTEKIAENNKAFQEAAEELGFIDAGDVAHSLVGVSGGAVVVWGTGSIIYGVCTSTTLPGFLAGTGSLSAGAAAGFATGGLILIAGLVVLAVGAAVVKLSRAEGDAASADMKEKFMVALEQLNSVNTVAKDHSKALSALEFNLSKLEIPLVD